MNTIKAICLDLDGVYFTDAGKRSFNEKLAEHGLSPEQIKEFHWSVEMKGLVRGTVSSEEFLVFVNKTLGTEFSMIEFEDMWADGYRVDEDVKSVVQRARELGYLACVCTSNNAVRLSALEKKFGFSQDFDCFISSNQVGETKPSSIIFQKLIDCTGVAPEEIVYADDNPERLSGASELGIKTFAYTTFPTFITELENLGVVNLTSD
ncbi:MAG: HAD superfamily hydrolase (TIGR01509 family) [Planctomycetota bacterium]|jgi:HAD superfamily hydrolase (TIGR01509 family)